MGGRGVKRRKAYPYVHEITDRHGHHRAYLRKAGCPSVPLSGCRQTQHWRIAVRG